MWTHNNRYGFTEAKSAHIFTTHPLVTEPVKVAVSMLTLTWKGGW
jgi:hypothetical protein